MDGFEQFLDRLDYRYQRETGNIGYELFLAGR
jgi:hypothetical protein